MFPSLKNDECNIEDVFQSIKILTTVVISQQWKKLWQGGECYDV